MVERTSWNFMITLLILGRGFFFSNLGCERDFCKINFFFLFFYFE